MRGIDDVEPVAPAVPIPSAVVYGGGLTMLTVCFANGLQQGRITSLSQATESLKHSFHVPDVALGALAFTTAICGAFGALPIGFLCARYPRTRVLAAMFAIWTVLIGALCLSTGFSVFGLTISGFVLFFALHVPISVTEATDPAALPLISDYWPLNQRAAKIGIFNAGAGVGAFLGIGLGGVLVDQLGWRGAFIMWVPLGVIGTLMMLSRREPRRGAQDADFRTTMAENQEGAEALELASHDAPPSAPDRPSWVALWATVRQIWALKTWRTVAIAMGFSQIMQSALQLWGPAYFKRTFHLSATKVGLLSPVIGGGAFVGIVAGGFIADALLRRGVLRARVWVSAASYCGAAVVFVAALATRSLALAAPLLALATTLSTLPTGPSYALLMDATPTALREEASGVADVVMLINAVGAPLVGGLSTLFGDNLRLALLCISPAYLVGGCLFLLARKTYVADMALVVADASDRVTGR
jgi:predicted MFS family arabinose efflux permease